MIKKKICQQKNAPVLSHSSLQFEFQIFHLCLSVLAIAFREAREMELSTEELSSANSRFLSRILIGQERVV
jgi:hypothetical protein